MIHIKFLEKTNELIDSAKHTAHDVSAKAQELEKSAEQKLQEIEKIGTNFIENFFFKIIFFSIKVNKNLKKQKNGLVKKDLKLTLKVVKHSMQQNMV